MEQVNIAGVNAKAVVYHREMTDAPGVKTIHGQHHVRAIKGMNEVRNDAIHLLSGVDFSGFILLIQDEGAIRGGDPYCFRFPGFMNNTKTGRRRPRDAAIRLREIASEFTKPLQNVARLNRYFGNELF
jgi:hypothetical protein